MTETFTSGMWTVKSGEEDAFVEDWKAFVTWSTEVSGSGTFRLMRDLDAPNRFLSIGSWESFEAQGAWKELPEFAELLGRARAHCDEFKPFTYQTAAEVS